MKKEISKSKENIYEAGFTLVETLVAIAIFATSITGLIAITAQGINDNDFVKNKLTASHLSAEGVELVRNMRDTIALSGTADSWETFLGDTSIGAGECYSTDETNICMIDGSVGQITAITCGEECPKLRYDEDSGTYGYLFNQETNFVRTISIAPISNDEVLIKSVVSWTQGQKTFTTSYQYNLLNWISI